MVTKDQANEIRAQMKRKGVTLDDVAEHLKVSRNTVSRKLNGKSEFTVSEVLNICEFLEAPELSKIFLPNASQK
jgi:transcriptional regulator with XRE-family HTH domain